MTQANKQGSKAAKKLTPVCNQALRQWGHSAFARNCRTVGIPFDDAYFMIFGKEPRTVLVQVDTGAGKL